MKNNNSGAIKRLSMRSLKANRTRNIFTLIAIILTTFMISSVFSIGISTAENISVMNTRLLGSAANIFLASPSEEQIDFVNSLDNTKSVGMTQYLGKIYSSDTADTAANGKLLYLNTSQWENHIAPAVGNIEGHYPQNTDEIMMSDKMLTMFGLENCKIGDKVTLTVNTDGKTSAYDFILCGKFFDYEYSKTSCIAYASMDFASACAAPDRTALSLSIKVSQLHASDVYQSILNHIGDADADNLSSSIDIEKQSSEGTVLLGAVIVMIALFIVLSGYLLIYNIMYISVTKDIHFYGLLKTIGTSPKQIRKIVLRQALKLSLIGIPAGIISSFAASFIVVPYALGAMTSDSSSAGVMPVELSFNPLIFIGAAVFSLMTVLISCRKPASTAGKVTPVEALKFTGSSAGYKKKTRNTTGGGKIGKMAFYNIFRDKKRAVIVFASLFMGTLTFLSVNSYFSSLDVNNYIDRYFPYDFEYQSYPPLSDVKFTDDFISALEDMDEIKDKRIIYADYATMPFDEETFRPVLEETVKTYGEEIGTFDELSTVMKNMAETDGYGTWAIAIPSEIAGTIDGIDLEAFERGETCILGYGEYDSMTGKTLTLTDRNTGKNKSVKIAGTFADQSMCDFASFSYSVGTVEAVFMSEKALKELTDKPTVLNISVNAEKGKEELLRSKLTELNDTLTNKTFFFYVRSEKAEGFSSSMKSINILTDGISVMLIFIGLINFVNVMVTGIYARRHELAVLESIGMTKKQIVRMLLAEGGWYGAITATLILTLGSALMLIIGKAVPYFVDYAVFTFPWMNVICLIAGLTAVCVAIPPLVYKLTAKDTVTDRLHTPDI